MRINGYNGDGSPIYSATSMNNRLILAAYENLGQLKTEIRGGIAMVSQKINLQPLVVLVDAKLSDGSIVPKGSKAFIKEASLHSSPWAKQIYSAEGVEGKFIIVDSSYVEFIEPKAQEK